MPKIILFKNLIFYLVSFDLSERLHLHVFSKNTTRGGSAKIWIDTLEVFDRGSLSEKEINTAIDLIKNNKTKISKLIEDFRNGKKINPLKL
ncbi:MAG: DUF4160 domain-containing protein [Bacteroidetes bacterium]|nr:MAG: DUF4160 domain-containing protein [Bacteroidota bacterium]